MGYMHIDNLYKRTELLTCYALEKIHGTSAHVKYTNELLTFFSGGAKHQEFVSLFSEEELLAKFQATFPDEGSDVTIYGEAFGGKMQGMSATYGPKLRFMAFDVKDNRTGRWYSVPSAEYVVKAVGLEFVPYEKGPINLQWLDSQRDLPSLVAIVPNAIREGIVIRPIHELLDANGGRCWIAKHKTKEFSEVKTERKITGEQLEVLSDAKKVADEWVTKMRLEHVLQKNPFDDDKDIKTIIEAMRNDVKREGDGEILWSRQVERAISKKTVDLLQSVSHG